MKAFEMVFPGSVEGALRLLPAKEDDRGSSVALAGGQDLLGEMKEHLLEPDRVVNLKRIGDAAGLRGVTTGGAGERTIGALTTVAELADAFRGPEAGPDTVLHEAALSVGSPQIRNVGTVGGNLCQRPRCWYFRNEHTVCLKKGGTRCFAEYGMSRYNAILGGGPSWIVHPSDLAPALVTLDAQVTIASPEGTRAVPVEGFYSLPRGGDPTRETVLAPNELVVGVTLPPRRDGWRSTYLKFRERGSFDWALSAVAVALRMEGDRIAAARMTLGGVAPVPWRCGSTEELLVGRRPDDETCRAAGEDALADAEPLRDNAYKVPLTRGLITRALQGLRGA